MTHHRKVEYTATDHKAAKVMRQKLMADGREVTLVKYDPLREVYTFDVLYYEQPAPTEPLTPSEILSQWAADTMNPSVHYQVDSARVPVLVEALWVVLTMKDEITADSSSSRIAHGYRAALTDAWNAISSVILRNAPSPDLPSAAPPEVDLSTMSFEHDATSEGMTS